jgi:hypothetical protein
MICMLLRRDMIGHALQNAFSIAKRTLRLKQVGNSS